MDNYVRLLNYLNDGPNTFEWPLDYTVVALRALGMTSASVSSTSVKIAFSKVLRRAKVLRGKVKPKWDTLPPMDFGHGRSNKMGMTPRTWQFLCRAAKPRVSTRCMAIFLACIDRIGEPTDRRHTVFAACVKQNVLLAPVVEAHDAIDAFICRLRECASGANDPVFNVMNMDPKSAVHLSQERPIDNELRVSVVRGLNEIWVAGAIAFDVGAQTISVGSCKRLVFVRALITVPQWPVVQMLYMNRMPVWNFQHRRRHAAISQRGCRRHLPRRLPKRHAAMQQRGCTKVRQRQPKLLQPRKLLRQRHVPQKIIGTSPICWALLSNLPVVSLKQIVLSGRPMVLLVLSDREASWANEAGAGPTLRSVD